jgi:hypothetical protein
MTEEQARAMINVTMANDEAIDEMFDGLALAFPFSAFFKRCSIFPIKYDKRLLIWIALMTYESNIGGMILVGYYVQYISNSLKEEFITVKNEIEVGPLSLQTAIEHIFPFGIFSKETIHEFWDKQKVDARPDNLVDYSSCQQSFMGQLSLKA